MPKLLITLEIEIQPLAGSDLRWANEGLPEHLHAKGDVQDFEDVGPFEFAEILVAAVDNADESGMFAGSNILAKFGDVVVINAEVL